MIGVYNFQEFKKYIKKTKDNKLKFEVAFPVINIKKPKTGSIAIEFILNQEEYLFLRNSIGYNYATFSTDIRYLYEIYIGQVLELLLRGEKYETYGRIN